MFFCLLKKMSLCWDLLESIITDLIDDKLYNMSLIFLVKFIYHIFLLVSLYGFSFFLKNYYYYYYYYYYYHFLFFWSIGGWGWNLVLWFVFMAAWNAFLMCHLQSQ